MSETPCGGIGKDGNNLPLDTQLHLQYLSFLQRYISSVFGSHVVAEQFSFLLLEERKQCLNILQAKGHYTVTCFQSRLSSVSDLYLHQLGK